MADTTGRIPLWLIDTVAGILIIGLLGEGEGVLPEPIAVSPSFN